MALKEMTENVEVVQTLSTYPNQEEGLSAEELKAKFDAGAKALKEYINGQLVPAVQELERVVNPGMTYNGYNQVISELGFSYGKGNFVGLKGYYYSSIDFTTNTITLSTKQSEADAEGIQVTWAVGDKVTIVNNSHYDRCSTITAINGNVITVDSLPFTEKVNIAEPNWDDYSIFVVDKPEAGIVDLGKYATAIGEENTATERAATGIGRENVVQGQYGVALGRGNKVKSYAGVAIGCKNTIEPTALYAFTEGVQNLATGLAAHAGGNNTKATAAGAVTEGYMTEASGEYAHASGRKTKATGNYSHAGGRETEASGEGSCATGYLAKATGNYSSAKGYGTEVSGEYASGEGINNKSAGRASYARGMETSAEASYSSAVGVRTRAMWAGSFAEGYGTIAEANYSHAAGVGTHTRTAGGFAVGTYNKPTTDQLFVVGNGTSEAKSNAFAVGTDGNTNVCGHRILNVADAVSETDAVNLRQLQLAKDVFWATYGKTTGLEIYNAYAGGKLVMCKRLEVNYILSVCNENWWEGEINGAECLFMPINVPVYETTNNHGALHVDLADFWEIESNRAMPDYVVAQGTSGIWTYRKWSSGVAECWGAINGNAPDSSDAFYFSQQLPFNFIGNIPITTGTLSDESSPAYAYKDMSAPIISCRIGSTAGVYETVDGSVLLPEDFSASVLGMNVYVHVIGRWK